MEDAKTATNVCPVCKPYSKPGYQDQTDGIAIPCFACNRAEFEKYALAHPKCPYCGKPIETPVQRKIYARPPRGTMTFCSEACGGYYQMGCEG